MRKGGVVDPNSVNWAKYSGKNVPYTFRQEPGPHNAPGRIKFIFPNKYFIFIKDIYGRDREVLKGLNEEFTIWQTRAIN